MPSAGLLLALLVGAGALCYVAAPLFRRDATEAERVARTLGEAADLQSRREMLLASLRDLEDDRATDKIDEADYEVSHARLSAEAIEVMRRLDRIDPRPAEDER